MVAVAIVSYQSAQDVAECLQALAASRHDDFEVVVCENGGPAAFDSLKARVPHSLPGGQAVRLRNAMASASQTSVVDRR